MSVHLAKLTVVLALVFAATLASRSAPASALAFTVTNTADSGAGSLRQAILDANASPGIDFITFNIPGAGVHTILPHSPLPSVTGPTIIDATTQPGTRCATAAAPSWLRVELEGTFAGPAANGLFVSGDNSKVRGLSVNHFGAAGITLAGNYQTLECNHLGLNPQGLVARPNGQSGASVAGSYNVVGGGGPGARNVISGNARYGLEVYGEYASIQGNFIGTSAPGTAAMANGLNGISMGGANVTVGGSTVGQGNVISGNGAFGIGITFGASYAVIQGNRIGTDPSGASAMPNGAGIGIASAGVAVSPRHHLIGGTTAAAANIIAFNRGDGISLHSTGQVATILGNRIFSNGGLGIDLLPAGSIVLPDGVSLNDALDADDGANGLQNFPEVVRAIRTAGGGADLSLALYAAPNSWFVVEVFSSDTLDPSGYGEGQYFGGRAWAHTDAKGYAAVAVALGPNNVQGKYLSATATDTSGNTSEFGPAFRIP